MNTIKLLIVYLLIIFIHIYSFSCSSNEPYDSLLLEELKNVKEKLGTNNNDYNLLIKYSNIQWGLGNYNEAYLFAKKAIYLKPNEPKGLINLSMILFSQKKFNDMLNLLEQIKIISPNNPALYDLYSKYYRCVKNYL